jgi:hypothetical protein
MSEYDERDSPRPRRWALMRTTNGRESGHERERERRRGFDHDRDRDPETTWRAVGNHRFDAADELDATLTAALDPERGGPVRIRGVDTEEAERLLASAREAGVDLVVRFYVDDRLVRIDADGVVAVRDDD